MNSRVLRQLRGEVVKKIEDLESVAKAAGREILNDEENAVVDKLLAEVTNLDAQILRAERVEEARAKSARPIEVNPVAPAPKDRAKGDNFIDFVRATGYSPKDIRRAAEFAEQELRNPEVAKALSVGTNTAGGYLVPEQISSDFIELLRPQVVIMESGARMMPMEGGNVTLNKLSAGATAAYGAENANIVPSEQTFAQVKLAAKKLMALVPISNDLLRRSNPAANAIVLEDMVESAAVTTDLNFLRGAAGGDNPIGIRNRAAGGQFVAINGTVNLANVDADLNKVLLRIIQNNIKIVTGGWITSPRVLMYLVGLRDGNGNLAFPTLQGTAPTLKGYPVRTTTSVPVNLGVGTNESEVYFADFRHVVIGDTMAVRVDVSDTAAYHDGTNVVSAFSKDQTVIRLIVEHDIGLRHDKAVAGLTAVTWS
jgi:HK97 family phage major capsid protein